jgi:adhesin transport system outer membrane protein
MRIIIILTLLITSNIFAFSLKEGYKKSLKNDMDLYINRTKLDSIGYDKKIAASLNKPNVDFFGQAQYGRDEIIEDTRKKEDSYSAVVTQNLFNGFESTYEKSLQKSRYESAYYNLKSTRNTLAYAYIESYLEVLKQKEILALLLENMNINESLLQKVFKKTSLGYGTKLEFNETSSLYAKSKLDYKSQKLNYKNAIENLRFYVQSSFDSNDLNKPRIYADLPNTYEEAFQLLQEKNTIYLTSKKNLEVTKYEELRDLKVKYPSLDLVGTYNKHNLFYASDEEYDEYKIELELKYNLYDGGKNKALNKKSKLNVKEKQYLVEKTLKKAENQLKLSWNNYNLLLEKDKKQKDYLISKKNILESTLAEFDIGFKTISNLVNSRNNLITTKIESATVKYDSMLSKFKVFETIGILSDIMDNPEISLEKKLQKELNKKSNKKDISSKLKSKNITNKYSKILLDEPIEKFNTKEKEITSPAKNSTFKTNFLSAPKEKFTINLAYFKEEPSAKRFIIINKLTENAFYFSFGKGTTYYKVMSGIFETKVEAQSALNNLSDRLKRSMPRVEKIVIKQKLYYKYHKDDNILTKRKKTKNLVLFKDNKKNMKPDAKAEKKYNNFKEKFLDAKPSQYTINLAYSDTKEKSQNFIDFYKIHENSFYFKFRSDKLKTLNYMQRIVYGVYNTKQEAMEALNALPSSIKINKPIIEIINRKQKLYNKYNFLLKEGI